MRSEGKVTSNKGTSINLLRAPNTSLGGTRNPHVLCVHSGFCAPSALSSGHSRQLIEVPTSDKFRNIGKGGLVSRGPACFASGLRLLFSFPMATQHLQCPLGRRDGCACNRDGLFHGICKSLEERFDFVMGVVSLDNPKLNVCLQCS